MRQYMYLTFYVHMYYQAIIKCVYIDTNTILWYDGHQLEVNVLAISRCHHFLFYLAHIHPALQCVCLYKKIYTHSLGKVHDTPMSDQNQPCNVCMRLLELTFIMNSALFGVTIVWVCRVGTTSLNTCLRHHQIK